MTPERLMKGLVIHPVHIEGFKFEMECKARHFECRVSFWAFDRDDPKKLTQVIKFFNFDRWDFELPDRHLLDRIFYEVRAMVTHEVAEMFEWEGERIFDPHKND